MEETVRESMMKGGDSYKNNWKTVSVWSKWKHWDPGKTPNFEPFLKTSVTHEYNWLIIPNTFKTFTENLKLLRDLFFSKQIDSPKLAYF